MTRCTFAIFFLASLLFTCATTAVAREWSDAAGHYTFEAELVAASDTTAVLKRADGELVAISIDELSERDREYLKSKEASEIVDRTIGATQTWTLRDGTKLTGRIVDYCDREVTIQRRRGHVFVNDRRLDNLPDVYQRLIPYFLVQYDGLEAPTQAAFNAWVLKQRGQPRTFAVKGVVVELESGDEYAVPFLLFSDEDQALLGPGFGRWQAARRSQDHDEATDVAFLLQSLAAARHHDQQVQREIALMNLQLQAVQAGLTSLWEVALYPRPGHPGPPRLVVVPGRNSEQAAAQALGKWPGFAVGPIRRVSGR